ncbi:hypothetical protein SNE40_000998 [Patella caerulea]|uniref:THAP4-like heme-binding domain-containing protein n=2 Tax=Patella caerulea TaxID=87958 RepID=A0AAN8KDI3_PATCE
MAAVHDMLKPLQWLLGKWRSIEGVGKFPTIKDFKYAEDLEFFQFGQPNIQYSYYSYDSTTKKPLHREIGFIRIKPNSNKVAFVSAHNMGLSLIEEGEVTGEEIKVESHTIARLTFGSEPETKKISRVIKKVGDELEQVLYMETSKTPLTEHLRIRYKKIE